jgi:hypothetical protein
VTARPDRPDGAAETWDVEYGAGRYRDQPPLPYGDLSELPVGAIYPLVISVQVFQHAIYGKPA